MRAILSTVVASIVLLACAALFWLGEEGSTETTQAAGALERASSPAPTSAPAAELGGPGADSGRTVVPAAAPSDETSDAIRTIQVSVVRAADGSPVAAADVYLLDQRAYRNPEFQAGRRDRRDEASLAERFGFHGRTGADGRVALDAVGQAGMVCGAAEGLWGEARPAPFEQIEGPIAVELRLEWDFYVEVLVVDERGMPLAGVPVAYRATDRWPRAHSLVTAPTDEQGRARLAHLGPYARWATGGGRDARHYVSIELPLPEPVFAEVDPAGPIPEPIRLVLPATGSVEVTVFDLEGRPAPDGALVSLQRRMSDEDRSRYDAGPSAMIRQSWLGLRDLPIQDGRVRFDWVGLGLRLEVGATLSVGGDLLHVEVGGPSRPGETVEVVLREARLTPQVCGQLLDGAGQPWTSQVDGWLYWPGGGDRVRRCRFPVRPDENGSFQASCAEVPVGSPLNGRFCFVASSPGEVRIWATEPVPAFPEGVLELGVLRLEPGVLVGGVVVDWAGQPLAECNVELGSAGPWIQLGQQASAEQVLEEMRAHLDAWTDNRGEFRFFAPLDLNSSHRLHVQPPRDRRELRRTSVDFVSGQAHLRVVMAAATGFRGVLLVDEEFRQDLELRARQEIRGPDGTLQGARERGVQWDRSGDFQSLLEPDQYTFLVRAEASDEVLHRVDPVQVLEGGMAELGTIDLRGLVHAVSLTVASESGAPIERFYAFAPAEVEGTFPQQQANPMRLVTVQPMPSFRIKASGHLPADVVLDRADVGLTLRLGLPVRVVVQGTEPMPEGKELRLRLVPNEGGHTQRIILQETAAVGHLEATSVFLPAAGRWTLYLDGLRRGANGGVSTVLLGSTEIAVEPGAAEQRVTLVADHDAVARFVQGGS